HSYYLLLSCICFFFNDAAPTEIYTLSLHDALPISRANSRRAGGRDGRGARLERARCAHGRLERPTWFADVRRARGRGLYGYVDRSEEHTSELQSRGHLVCRLLLEKKKNRDKSVDVI